MSGRASRDRGARAELAVAKFLRANGFPGARRYLAGDGRQPGDIDFHPEVCLEVQDVERSSWPSWRAQAMAEARPGQLVVVVRRVRGVTDVGRWDAQSRLVGTPIDLPVSSVQACPRTGVIWASTTLAEIVHHLQPRCDRC